MESSFKLSLCSCFTSLNNTNQSGHFLHNFHKKSPDLEHNLNTCDTDAPSDFHLAVLGNTTITQATIKTWNYYFCL